MRTPGPLLRYTGATATSSKPIVLDAAGGDLSVGTSGTTLTLSGVISEIGGTGRALSVQSVGGGSGVALTGANTYTGPTLVNFGAILSIPTFANGGVASPLGASTNAPANLQIGGGGVRWQWHPALYRRDRQHRPRYDTGQRCG